MGFDAPFGGPNRRTSRRVPGYVLDSGSTPFTSISERSPRDFRSIFLLPFERYGNCNGNNAQVWNQLAREVNMCDYSLGGMRNRLAIAGEDLVVHRFSTLSIGLASCADLSSLKARAVRRQGLWNSIISFLSLVGDCPDVLAVCIPPGARLIVKGIPLNLQHKWEIGPEERVVFVQTSAEVNTYRDAIEFRNGCKVSLQHLTEGMSVRVVSLGGDSVFEQEPEAAFPNRL